MALTQIINIFQKKNFFFSLYSVHAVLSVIGNQKYKKKKKFKLTHARINPSKFLSHFRKTIPLD